MNTTDKHAPAATGAQRPEDEWTGIDWATLLRRVYDLDALDRFLDRAGGPPLPMLVGVLPLHSSRHAEFLHNEVPGITVPDPVRARMRAAGERGLAAGIDMAQRLVADIRRRHAGAYLMPSFGRFEVVAEVLDALR